MASKTVMSRLHEYGLVGAIAVIGLSGCTTQSGYETVRGLQREHCLHLPDTEQERCLNAIQDDYETYRRKRDEVIHEHDEIK